MSTSGFAGGYHKRLQEQSVAQREPSGGARSALVGGAANPRLQRCSSPQSLSSSSPGQTAEIRTEEIGSGGQPLMTTTTESEAEAV